jgi:LmbE family N-acetylglucosaminyl deacetylase
MLDAVGLLEENQPVVYAVYRERDQARHPDAEPLEEPDLRLDISPTKEEKIAAARCHRSQQALFLRNAALRAGRPVTLPELISSREDLVRVRYPGEPAGHPGIEHIVQPLLLD